MTATTQLAFEDDLDYEIVNGQKEVKMAGARHGLIGARLTVELGIYLKQNPMGELFNANTTFMIGANERMPDVSFVSAARIPEDGVPVGKWESAPDLAIEVISPTDTWGKVCRQVQDCFAAGVRQLWLLSPLAQQVMVYDSLTQIKVLTADQDLTSETLLPGFRCRVGDLFKS